jgi:hypothetical protein
MSNSSRSELTCNESTDHWPSFSLRYTFNPEDIDGPEFRPDDLVVFDARADKRSNAWIAAARGSYVAIEETR